LEVAGREGRRPERYTVPRRPGGVFSQLEDAYLSGWRWILSADLPAPAVYTRVRAGEKASAILRPDPLLPVGLQRLPEGAERATLIWLGGSAAVEIGTMTGSRFVNSEGFAFADLPLADVGRQARITLPGPDLAWDVLIGGEPPLPPWWTAAAGAPASEAQRAVRAAWLLREGPSEWKLFAISELRELARSDHFPSAALWAAIVSSRRPDWEAVG
jgi:hypothetical protein